MILTLTTQQADLLTSSGVHVFIEEDGRYNIPADSQLILGGYFDSVEDYYDSVLSLLKTKT